MRVWKWFRARPKWLQIALWILLTLPVLAAYAWPKGGKGKGIAIALAGAWIFVMSAVAFGNGGVEIAFAIVRHAERELGVEVVRIFGQD